MGGAVIAVAASVAGTAAASAVSGAVLSAVVGGVVTAAVTFAGSALLGSGKKPSMDMPSFNERGGGMSQMVRQPVTSWKYAYGRVRTSGPMTFIHSNGDKNKNLYIIFPLAAGEIDAVEELYLDDELVELSEDGAATNSRWLKDGSAHVFCDFHLGAPDQTANQRFMDECDGKWTVDHRMRGIAYAALKLVYDQKMFPGGIPNPTVVYRGRKVLDPRSGTTLWTENAALCIRDYLLTPEELGGYGVPAERINEDSFRAAANICDEEVPLKNGGTEPRYTCNGVVDTEGEPFQILSDMLSSCGGSLDVAGGRWNLRVASASPVVADVRQSMARASVSVQPRRNRTDLFNAVRGTFICVEQKWQPTDYPFVTNDEYVQQDGGHVIYTELDLPFTRYPATAQRLAKMYLERHRLQSTVDFPGNLSLLPLVPGEPVNLHLPECWEGGAKYRIAEWRLADDGLGVDLTLQQDDDRAYQWDPEVDEQDMPEAPEVEAPNGADTTPPSPVEELAASGGSGQATITWICPMDEDFERSRVYRHTADDYAAAELAGLVYSLPGENAGWTDSGLLAGTYYYWVRTEDETENRSEYGVAVSAVVT